MQSNHNTVMNWAIVGTVHRTPTLLFTEFLPRETNVPFRISMQVIEVRHLSSYKCFQLTVCQQDWEGQSVQDSPVKHRGISLLPNCHSSKAQLTSSLPPPPPNIRPHTPHSVKSYTIYKHVWIYKYVKLTWQPSYMIPGNINRSKT